MDKKSSPEKAKLFIIESLEDSKARDIVAIDLYGKSSLADVMLIATGGSARHVHAIADRVLRSVKEHHLGSARVEGLTEADWVLIDTGDIIVHIFQEEKRLFYNLEKLWHMPQELEAVRQRAKEGKESVLS